MLESKDHSQVQRFRGALDLTFAARTRGGVGSECQIRPTSNDYNPTIDARKVVRQVPMCSVKNSNCGTGVRKVR
jgi:hypothetical protein